ncbi:MAG: hypothetical protein IJB44_04435 [Clostridia bacterium]|nr:hypothetical protein [Clostridia bacterium]
MELSKETLLLLEDIERRIDPETEEDLEKQWLDFTYGRFDGDIFCPKRKKTSPPSVEPQGININDAIKDYDLMLRSQLSGVSWALNGTHNTLCVRANYGTGIMTSVFGAEIFVMPYENNTLPTTRPLNDTEKIRRIVEKDGYDIMSGFGKNVFEFGEICAEVFEKYPKIKKYVNVYHPDTQGPLDICELLWGCEMFYALYDEPDLAHAMLSLITDAYIAVMDKWYDIFPKNTVLNHHWGGLCHKGTIVLRSDSAMNISPEIYREFSMPYDKKLLDYYGGGIVHFCGRGDHYIEILSKLNGLYGINMSQPECNDMEKIYKNTVDKGIKILCFNHSRANEDKCRQGGFNGCLSV